MQIFATALIGNGRTARNRMRDLGSGVFVGCRSRLAHRGLALFRRLDGHAQAHQG
jgi:hypothetical protein